MGKDEFLGDRAKNRAQDEDLRIDAYAAIIALTISQQHYVS